MKKLYFKTEIEGIDELCLIPCEFGKNAYIGSYNCTNCTNCYNYSHKDNYVECIKHATKDIKILICNNCKSYHLDNVKQCDCGSTTLTETSEYNIINVENLLEKLNEYKA